MNGISYLFDTNAIIYFLKGDLDLYRFYNESETISISIISCIEFLSYPNLNIDELALFENFAQEVNVFNIEFENKKLINKIVELRSMKLLKIPDTIIAAQAIDNNLTLLTRDKQFERIPELSVISF
ncbi:MAG: PIN domain-containing protein [Leptospiraceae bacterium]|nr:PIN domain-containing protein [Leptospiraceae bacterium]